MQESIGLSRYKSYLPNPWLSRIDSSVNRTTWSIEIIGTSGETQSQQCVTPWMWWYNRYSTTLIPQMVCWSFLKNLKQNSKLRVFRLRVVKAWKFQWLKIYSLERFKFWLKTSKLTTLSNSFQNIRHFENESFSRIDHDAEVSVIITGQFKRSRRHDSENIRSDFLRLVHSYMRPPSVKHCRYLCHSTQPKILRFREMWGSCNCEDKEEVIEFCK